MANKNNSIAKSLVPSKTVINFINQDKEKANWSKAGIIAAGVVVLGLFIYFGLYIPNKKIDSAIEAHNSAQDELLLLQNNNSDFADVQAEYSVRLNGFMTDEEHLCENREEMLDIVFDNQINGSDLVSINIDGSEMTVIVKVSSLDVASDYLDSLNSDSRVLFASIDSSSEIARENNSVILVTYHVEWNEEWEEN